ncbi:ABC transporter substrate-binding protein [Natranaerobius thermophilus]|uniref:Extracellular solute-binding protein family 5 n=1 Tax=Natranaerobius thermophilus (strain ATCC BAA-1301 / DSM 18059 / JW/NM-WN-LF) TaxID=457570 RepID=B2A2X0_NATTJ|nr:ABC transporter substrate-binding protein [Natranaerobius thermophilus]ACB86338.1 extracellular solute-binding protein family 5 [Natranaerobius thermophilus JW/NM-WN-LF]
MIQKLKKLAIVTTCSALILTACGGEVDEEAGGKNDEQGSKEEALEVEYEDRLTIGMGTDMVTFDIHDHNNTSTEAVHINIFDYLFRQEDGEIQSELVSKHEIIDDETWKFKLKEGVKFHNGDELTSKDVQFTFHRVIEDSSLTEHSNYNQISEVEVINDYEFYIHTEDPEPALLNRISRMGSGILPKDYIEEEGWDHFLDSPIGSGPYEFVEWERDNRVVLNPFEDYYGDYDSPWEEVVYRVIPEDSTRVSELLTGGVDLAVNVPPTDWDRVDDNQGTLISTGDSNRVMLLILNHEEGRPTEEQKVREAIDYAIDNEALTESILDGQGTPVRTRVTPGNTGYNEELYDDYRYDPDYSRELLEEAGYSDGVELKFHAPQGRYLMDSDVSEMITGMLAEVGINADLNLLEFSQFADKYLGNENEDLMFLGLSNSMFDAAHALRNFHSEQNTERTYYENERVDELLEKAESNMDFEERKEQYQEVQEIVAEELPYVYLYQQKDSYGINNRIDFEPRLDEMIYIPEIGKTD